MEREEERVVGSVELQYAFDTTPLLFVKVREKLEVNAGQR